MTTPRQGPEQNTNAKIEGFTFLRSGVRQGQSIVGEMLETARTVDRAVREFQPDVIHSHSPVLAGLPALRIARRHGTRFVYEVRALWEDAAVDHGSSGAKGLRYRMSRAMESYVLRRADHVTCICEGLREEIVGRGVSPDRVTVIPNAVDVERFTPADYEADWLKEGGRPFRVGFIGSFYRYEGLDLLIKAAALLKDDGFPISVLLVGGGPEAVELIKLTEKFGVEDVVTFTGRVDNSQVTEYYGSLDALVYPRRSSRLTEMVTPLKPLEAMANGKLVLATSIGGHRELIEDGVTGLLSAPDSVSELSKLIRVAASDPGRCLQLVANGVEFVHSKCTWQNSVAKYVAAYGLADA